MVVWEDLNALSHQFELCKIDPSSRVVVLLDATVDPQRAELVRAAVTRTGAQAIEVRPTASDRASVDRLTQQELLPALFENADVVITNGDQLGEATRASLTQAGCAVLHLGNDISPSHYPPHANLRRRLIAMRKQLRDAATLTVTDPHGTDLTIDLANCTVRYDHGVITNEVHEATFPAGWVQITPNQGTVFGDIVVMPGDANVSARRMVSSPMRLQLANDLLTAIDGENPDTDFVRAQFEYPAEPDAYGFASITVGLNPGRDPLELFDQRLLDDQRSRLAAGMVQVSFGNNLTADRPCSQTVTLGLPGRTVLLDDMPVVSHGRLHGDFAPDVYER